MAIETTLPPGKAHVLPELLGYAEHGISSRVLAKTGGGNATLFAFEKGQALSEHVSPYEALVFVLEGDLTLTIGGEAVKALPGTVTRMPAGVPHSVDASERTRMLLFLLREPKG